MIRLFRALELEWKILLLAFFLFFAALWPVQSLMSARFDEAVRLSVDPNLEALLKNGLSQMSDPASKEAYVQSLERHKQWQAMAEILRKEQRAAITALSALLMLFLLALSAITLRRLTRPLKNLAFAAEQIGRGVRPVIFEKSGGAVGRLEQAMAAMENELSTLRGKLMAEGMEQAWRDIARVMAHEIKNPLTPIRLTLDRLEERLANGRGFTPAELQGFLSQIAGQVDQLERLVQSFSSFAREPEAVNSTFDPRAVLENAAEGFRNRLQARFSGSFKAKGDTRLFLQVALNIFKNSVEAGAENMEILLEKKEDYISISIKDNGKGMSPLQLEKAFVPYVTYKQGGTGLGLAVVKRLMESMQGFVFLKPSENGGLCVVLGLPLAAEQS